MCIYELIQENINGYKIEYAISGNIDNPVMIFAHGLGGNLRQWDEQMTYFNKKYRTVAFSLQGHGNSSKSDIADDYMIERYAEVAILLIEKLNISSCIWIGNSLGGVIGYEILKNRPELISQIITNGTAPALEYSKGTLKMIRALDKTLIKIIGYERYINIAVNATLNDISHRLVLKKLFMSAYPLAIIESHQLLGKYNYLKTLENAHVPITIILTPNDKDINKIIQKYRNRLEQTKMVNLVEKDSGGHVYNIEMSEDYNNTLETILSTSSKIVTY